MSDLTERLVRLRDDRIYLSPGDRTTLADAANRIEELEGALEELTHADDEVTQFEHVGDVARFARRALRGEGGTAPACICQGRYSGDGPSEDCPVHGKGGTDA